MAQGEKSLCENRIIIVFHGLWDMSHNGRTSLNKKTSTQKKERKGEGGVCESVRERQGERRREGGREEEREIEREKSDNDVLGKELQ